MAALPQRRGSYFEDFLRKKGITAPIHLERDKLISDRAAYISYLESTIERLAFACMTVEDADSRMAAQDMQISALQSSVESLTAMITGAQSYSERQGQECGAAVAALHVGLNEIDARLQAQSETLSKCAALVATIEQGVNGHANRIAMLEDAATNNLRMLDSLINLQTDTEDKVRNELSRVAVGVDKALAAADHRLGEATALAAKAVAQADTAVATAADATLAASRAADTATNAESVALAAAGEAKSAAQAAAAAQTEIIRSAQNASCAAAAATSAEAIASGALRAVLSGAAAANALPSREIGVSGQPSALTSVPLASHVPPSLASSTATATEHHQAVQTAVSSVLEAASAQISTISQRVYALESDSVQMRGLMSDHHKAVLREVDSKLDDVRQSSDAAIQQASARLELLASNSLSSARASVAATAAELQQRIEHVASSLITWENQFKADRDQDDAELRAVVQSAISSNAEATARSVDSVREDCRGEMRSIVDAVRRVQRQVNDILGDGAGIDEGGPASPNRLTSATTGVAAPTSPARTASASAGARTAAWMPAIAHASTEISARIDALSSSFAVGTTEREQLLKVAELQASRWSAVQESVASLQNEVSALADRCAALEAACADTAPAPAVLAESDSMQAAAAPARPSASAGTTITSESGAAPYQLTASQLLRMIDDAVAPRMAELSAHLRSAVDHQLASVAQSVESAVAAAAAAQASASSASSAAAAAATVSTQPQQEPPSREAVSPSLAPGQLEAVVSTMASDREAQHKAYGELRAAVLHAEAKCESLVNDAVQLCHSVADSARAVLAKVDARIALVELGHLQLQVQSQQPLLQLHHPIQQSRQHDSAGSSVGTGPIAAHPQQSASMLGSTSSAAGTGRASHEFSRRSRPLTRSVSPLAAASSASLPSAFRQSAEGNQWELQHASYSAGGGDGSSHGGSAASARGAGLGASLAPPPTTLNAILSRSQSPQGRAVIAAGPTQLLPHASHVVPVAAPGTGQTHTQHMHAQHAQMHSSSGARSESRLAAVEDRLNYVADSITWLADEVHSALYSGRGGARGPSPGFGTHAGASVRSPKRDGYEQTTSTSMVSGGRGGSSSSVPASVVIGSPSAGARSRSPTRAPSASAHQSGVPARFQQHQCDEGSVEQRMLTDIDQLRSKWRGYVPRPIGAPFPAFASDAAAGSVVDADGDYTQGGVVDLSAYDHDFDQHQQQLVHRDELPLGGTFLLTQTLPRSGIQSTPTGGEASVPSSTLGRSFDATSQQPALNEPASAEGTDATRANLGSITSSISAGSGGGMPVSVSFVLSPVSPASTAAGAAETAAQLSQSQPREEASAFASVPASLGNQSPQLLLQPQWPPVPAPMPASAGAGGAHPRRIVNQRAADAASAAEPGTDGGVTASVPSTRLDGDDDAVSAGSDTAAGAVVASFSSSEQPVDSYSTFAEQIEAQLEVARQTVEAAVASTILHVSSSSSSTSSRPAARMLSRSRTGSSASLTISGAHASEASVSTSLLAPPGGGVTSGLGSLPAWYQQRADELGVQLGTPKAASAAAAAAGSRSRPSSRPPSQPHSRSSSLRGGQMATGTGGARSNSRPASRPGSRRAPGAGQLQ